MLSEPSLLQIKQPHNLKHWNISCNHSQLLLCCRFWIHIYSTIRSNIVVIYLWLWELKDLPVWSEAQLELTFKSVITLLLVAWAHFYICLIYFYHLFFFFLGIVIAELIDNAFDEVGSFLLSFEWLWFFLKYAYVISEVTLSIFHHKLFRDPLQPPNTVTLLQLECKMVKYN